MSRKAAGAAPDSSRPAPGTSLYRPALRAFVFGALAVGLRAGSLGLHLLTSFAEDEPGIDLGLASWLLTIAEPLGTILALVGVAYAAIAAHRREWSVVLVLAWILSVTAALFVPAPFVYFDF